MTVKIQHLTDTRARDVLGCRRGATQASTTVLGGVLRRLDVAVFRGPGNEPLTYSYLAGYSPDSHDIPRTGPTGALTVSELTSLLPWSQSGISRYCTYVH
jgi:hypothetical protein